MAETGITIIYDGDCPFCASYVRMVRLRETVGAVALVDARSDAPEAAAAREGGQDLDSGMLVLWQGRSFHGAEAVHLLALLSGPGGGLNAVQRRLFAGPRRAALLYPVLAAGRRLFFRLTGRRLIGAGEKSGGGSE